jgi:hypothetical protein
MPILHIEHRITDLDTWLQVFNSRAQAREQAGVAAVHIFQSEEDPGHIVELLFFDTDEGPRNYQKFLREYAWLESSPGLAGHPHAAILHEVKPNPNAGVSHGYE